MNLHVVHSCIGCDAPIAVDAYFCADCEVPKPAAPTPDLLGAILRAPSISESAGRSAVATAAADAAPQPLSPAVALLSHAKEPEAASGSAKGGRCRVRVGESGADLTATSEFMGVTAGETATNSGEVACGPSLSVAAVTDRRLTGPDSRATIKSAPEPSAAFAGPATQQTLSVSCAPPMQTASGSAFACSDLVPSSEKSTTRRKSGVGPDAANPRQSHLQGVTGGESAATNSNSGDGLGVHKPGSHTWGGDLLATAPSGRADDSAKCPAVAGSLSVVVDDRRGAPALVGVSSLTSAAPSGVADFSDCEPFIEEIERRAWSQLRGASDLPRSLPFISMNAIASRSFAINEIASAFSIHPADISSISNPAIVEV